MLTQFFNWPQVKQPLLIRLATLFNTVQQQSPKKLLRDFGMNENFDLENH